MSLLTVGPTGLQTLATHCEAWSAHVAVTCPPAAPTASFQATAAAVGAVHVTTGATGEVLGTRLTANAGHLNGAAAGFSGEDAEDAATLAGLSGGV